MNIDELPVKDNLSGEQIEYLQKKQHEYKHIGRMNKVPGHTLFSFNRNTKEIKPARLSEKFLSVCTDILFIKHDV